MKALRNGLQQRGDCDYSELYIKSLNRIIVLAEINSIKALFKGNINQIIVIRKNLFCYNRTLVQQASQIVPC